MDNWSRLLPFASMVDLTGGTSPERIITTGILPIDWISVLLVKLACRDIEFIGKENYPSRHFVPVGWFETEYTMAIDSEADEESESVEELATLHSSVMVYESNKSELNYLIAKIMKEVRSGSCPSLWSKEKVDIEELKNVYEEKYSHLIDQDACDVDGNLLDGNIHIIRHIAQNEIEPEFVDFDVRDQFDIDQLAKDHADLTRSMEHVFLMSEFNDSRKMWKTLYKKFSWFQDAYNQSWNRIVSGPPVPPKPPVPPSPPSPPQPEDYKQSLMSRDNKQCRCCGRKFGKGVKLEIDHILPVKLGGRTELDNLQLLCKTCNREKGTELLNFLNSSIELIKPSQFSLIRTNAKEPASCSIKRIINFYFRAAAVSDVKYHERSSGRNYTNWVIEIHRDNRVELLKDYEFELLRYIRDELGYSHVKDISIVKV